MKPTPFLYFGNKRKIAERIWERFGDPKYYYEPFAGALGCLLNRPPFTGRRYEYVGDIFAMITNFWRAAQWAPQDVAKHAEWPSNEFDLRARMEWLTGQEHQLRQSLLADPRWFDAEIAGWYAWCDSQRISKQGKCLTQARRAGVAAISDLPQFFADLEKRLKSVKVFHYRAKHSWLRLADGAQVRSVKHDVAILLDPPYATRNGADKLYEHDRDAKELSLLCRNYCLDSAHAFPRLKIALCGYAGEHDMPKEWEVVPWRSQYGKAFERIWFSPNCLKAT